MKSTALHLILASSLIAAGLSACKKSDRKDAASATPVINVALPEVDSIVLHKTYPGLLIAGTTAQVVGRVNGTILSKNYESGAYVSKGQVLFTIEPDKYREAAAQASAALATAESEYQYASKNYEALKEALKSDAVSQIEVIQAKSAMEQAEAAIKNARAALGQANLNLSHCTVRAPFAGYVTSSTLDPGNYISGEAAPVTLCTIYDISQMVASFDIEDSQYENMVGQKGGMDQSLYRNIPISFSETLPHSYTADLYYQSPSVDSKTGTLRLQGMIDNKYNELKDGMYATVSLPYGVNPKAILIKDSSIGTDQLGKYVYVVNDSDKVVYTPVKTGELYRDSLRVITEGLSAGDRYVTEALLSVRNGMQVTPHTVK